MLEKITISDLDVVFLSYDEPNADSNYDFLLRNCPRAKRVHEVKGSDAAHKACAELASTDLFITIDGDTKVDRKFWTQEFSLTSDLWGENPVFSFSSQNLVNGLCYGNGGIKIWPKTVVENMKTHEAAEPGDSRTDFCWALDYVLMPGTWSQTVINSTEKQAWRAGFREGVKFSLIDGFETKDPDKWQYKVAEPNLKRLCVWQQVGCDVKNGAWSILGARQGFYKSLLTDWKTENVQDFDYLDMMWEEIAAELQSPADLKTKIVEIGRDIIDSISIDITTVPPEPQISRWIKKMFPAEERTIAKRLRT
jgi:hypothetical protein